MSEQLEDVRKICSNYIREYLGEEYDTTPWMDKLHLYGLYKAIKIQEGDKNAAKVCNSGQENQKTEERILYKFTFNLGFNKPCNKEKRKWKSIRQKQIKKRKV
jgi:hypothetical protein